MACMKEDLSESNVKIEFDFKVRELSYVFWKKIDAELITKRQYQTVETEITFEQAVLQFGMSLHKISKEYDLLKIVSNPQDDIISVSLLPYSIIAYIDRAKGSFSILAPHVSPWEADYTQWKSALDFIQVYLDVDLSPLEKEVQEIKNKLYLNAKAALIVGTTIKSLCDSFLPKKNWDYQLDQQCLKSEIILKTSEGIFYDIEMYHKPFANDAKLLIDLLNNPHEEFIPDTVSCQILAGNLKEMKAAIKESFFRIKQISKTIQSSHVMEV